MVKIFLAIIAATALYAVDFKTFEAEALKRSPDIASARLQSDIALLQKEIALRYENPEIEAEVSSFSPDNRKRQSGWRFGVSQPFRLFGLQKDLENYGDSLTLLAKAEYERSRAGFVAALRRGYTDYVMANSFKRLLEEEIALAERVEAIAKERFKSGGGTKAAVMQASLEKISAQSRLIELEREITQRYFRLLNIAGIPEGCDLEAKFLYGMESGTPSKKLSSPDLAAAKKRETLLLAEAETKSRRIKSYRLVGEVEKEPDQSIGRIGLAFDLPLFNRSNQEYRVAKIRAKQAALQRERIEMNQRIRFASLAKQLEILKKRYSALQSQLEKERQLLTLFEEGYRVAQSSLLDLIRTKNALIETRRQLLQTRYLSNLYKIETEYLKGKI
ncbi:TolC family protein [Hydrogenimonas sp.]